MTLHDQMRNDLLAQKAKIESRGKMRGDLFVLDIGTYVIKKGNKHYASGVFGFDDPDEMDYRTANEIAFKNGAAVFKSEVYWGKKYQTILQALSSL